MAGGSLAVLDSAEVTVVMLGKLNVAEIATMQRAVAVLEARRTPAALLWSRGVWQLVIGDGEAKTGQAVAGN